MVSHDRIIGIQDFIPHYLQQSLSTFTDPISRVQLLYPKHAKFGHVSTNVAFVLAKKTGELASVLACHIRSNLLHHAAIQHVDVVGGGFLNFFFDTEWLTQVIHRILSHTTVGVFQSLPPVIPPEVQYAYFRIQRLCNHAEEWANPATPAYHLLTRQAERVLILLLNRHPRLNERKPLQILAKAVHNYYNVITILCENMALQQAKLQLLKAVGVVLAGGMQMVYGEGIEDQ